MPGLSGRRVLVTRSADRAADMIALLGERGATAVLLPTISSAPVVDPTELMGALGRIGEYDWLVFTSVTAVNVVFDALAAHGMLALPRRPRIAAVGAVTAAAVGQRGAAAHAVPGVFRGEELGRALGAAAGTRVLLPRADIARAETAAALRATGARVDDVVAYRTMFTASDIRLSDVLDDVDAITFTSPSTVHGLARAADVDLPSLVAQRVIASIGPTTSAAVRRCGMPVHIEPAVHTTSSMVNDLDAYFAAGRARTI